MKAIKNAGRYREIEKAYEENKGEEIVTELIASENNIPKFMAGWLYNKVEPSLREKVEKASDDGNRPNHKN